MMFVDENRPFEDIHNTPLRESYAMENYTSETNLLKSPIQRSAVSHFTMNPASLAALRKGTSPIRTMECRVKQACKFATTAQS